MNKTFIEREDYINQIIPYIGKDLIKVFIGQRRVGKSYLLFQVMDLLEKRGIKKEEIIYINKESLDWENIENYKDLYNEVKDFKYIFVDEIGDILEWEKAIRSLQAEGGKDIYITGSNSNLLSGELASFLSGRYISIDVYPLNYREFLKFHKLEKGENSFYKYIEFGGLPYLKNLELKSEIVNSYLRDVVDTIILKDIISRFNVRNIDFFRKLIIYLAREIGSIFSAKNISDYLISQKTKISTNVVLNYLSYSKQALFLNEVSRFDIKGKKIFELRQKYYFTDIGLRNAILGGFNNLYMGGILENVVYINLLSKGYKVTIGEIYKKEVDFIAEKNGKRIYIQVSYILENQSTIDREFGVFSLIGDNWPKYVITLDKKTGGFIDGIEHKNIIDFIYEL